MKSVLITGASKGLGRALFDHYLALGRLVYPLVRDPKVADNMVASAPDGRCVPIISDICDSDVETRVKEALSGSARLDLLVNNAGIPGRSSGLDNTSAAEAKELFNVHVIGALSVARAAVPFLLNATQPTIVNVSSRLGSLTKSASGEFSGKGFSYTYRIAKAAQNMLSACLAEEFGPQGIVVFALHPGQFVSETAASGATRSAAEAASGIADWIGAQNRKAGSIQFSQPNAGSIPW